MGATVAKNSLGSHSFPILSLFSGIGGLDLGFRREGFQTLLALDHDPWAVATYNLNNHPGVAEIGDLATLRGRGVLKRWNVRNRMAPRGVIGGPPCQAFSRSNVHPKKRDGRARLVSSFASIVDTMHDEFDIDFFVFENVVGLVRDQHKQHLLSLERRLKPSFRISAVQLDAADYGVPQHRRRLFVIGVNRLRYPHAVFMPGSRNAPPGTVRRTIGGLKEPVYFSRGLDPEQFPVHPNHWTMRPRSGKFKDGTLKKPSANGRSFRVLEWDEPSWTVSYGHREIHIHPRRHRRLSVFEAMLLQGFPRRYRLLGSLSDQIRLVSDAVPPPFARAVARALRVMLHRRRGP